MGLCRCGGAGRPERPDPQHCRAPAGARPSAGHTTPWPRPRRCDGLWPEARLPGRAAPQSRPCTSDISLRALARSDDPPHAPWLASAAHGTSSYRGPRSPEIPPDSFSRKPYDWPFLKAAVMLGCDQTREDLQAPAPDHEVMVAAPEVHASHLDDPNAPPLRPVGGSKLLEMDDGVTETVQVQVVLVCGQVVEQEYGRVVKQEEVLEGEHLAAVAQRPLREQADFGEAVENHSGGTYPLHLGQD